MIHTEPIRDPLSPVDVINPAAIALHKVTLCTPNRVMVQRNEIISPGLRRHPPPIAPFPWRHGSAISTNPPDAVVIYQAFRTVHAQAPEQPVIFEHCLEAPGLVRPRAILRRAMLELMYHRNVLKGFQVAIAEQSPRHGNHIRIVRGVKQIRQAALADVDVNILIHIHGGAPRGTPHGCFTFRRAKGRVLRDMPGRAVGVISSFQNAFGRQSVQQFVRPVNAVVGVDKKPIHADNPMMRDPIKDIRPFVFHRRHDSHAFP